LPEILKNHNKYYWVTGGQLPSINLALFLNLIKFDTKFTTIGHDPIGNDCFPLKLTSQVYEYRLKDELLSLSRRYEYAAILNLSNIGEVSTVAKIGNGLQALEWAESMVQKPFVNMLIDGLEHPFELDENEEDDNEDLDLPVTEVSAKTSALLNEIRKKIEDLNGIDDKSRPHKLLAIYLSAKIKYFKQQSYSDFLMRIFTMTEVLLLPELAPLISAGKIQNIRLADLIPDKKASSITVTSILSDKEWQKFIQDYRPYPYDWKIGPKCQPSFFFHRAIWECFFEKDPCFQKDKNIILKDVLVYIDALRNIRNKVAHNLEGTGQQEILDSFIDIDGDPKKSGRLFVPINKIEYSPKYKKYEEWISLLPDIAQTLEPSTSWSDKEKEDLRKTHEANFFTLCDKYFGIHQEGIDYDKNFGFFDTHINPLIRYYLGITDNL
jgi:hypothetical protein